MPPGLQIITIQNWGSLELEMLHEFRGLEKPWCFATALALDLPCVELGNLTHISCQWLWVHDPYICSAQGNHRFFFQGVFLFETNLILGFMSGRVLLLNPSKELLYRRAWLSTLPHLHI
jgi:hypothetical protein